MAEDPENPVNLRESDDTRHASVAQTMPVEAIAEKNEELLSWSADLKQTFAKSRKDYGNLFHEVIYELKPTSVPLDRVLDGIKSWIHVPYLPAFHQPGWMLAYIAGPYDLAWVESIFVDIWAGITVGLTLIPQGLSYATLANLQPIQGLYAAVIPSAMYTFFGSSLQLAVGPVAVVSLLTGQIVAKYVPNYADPAHYTEASDVAAELALVVGFILMILSLLNLGNIIRYVSFSVISGFTSGAACVIGLNQLKSAFGFSNSDVPQQGQPGYDYNYQVMRWYRIHFYDRYHFTASQLKMPTGSTATQSALKKWHQYILREGELFTNKYAIQICFSLYCALLVIVWIKAYFKETPDRKKKIVFRAWFLLSALCPFFGIIIAAHMAWRIKSGDHYTDPNFKYTHEYNAYYLKIVGQVPSGLNLIRIPQIRVPISELIGEAIPIAVVAYMESYSVAKTIASSNGQLHILNASQELWANGIANILGAVSSGYPVSGSFSRSALNYSCGARTPLSKITTMLVVIISLLALTSTFQYIPQAALAAVIMAAIYNIISFSDLWVAWKNNKKDFFTILITWIITLTFNTEIGLAVGIGISIATLLIDQASADTNAPEILRKAVENEGVAVVRMRQDLNFLTAGRLRDVMMPLFLPKPAAAEDHTRLIDRIFAQFTLSLDYVLLIHKPKYAEFQPKAILIDFSFVNTVDLSGMTDLHELQKDMRRYGVKSMVINAMRCIEEQLIKFGIENDSGPGLESVAAYGGNIPIRASKPSAAIPNVETYRSLDNFPGNEASETKVIDDEQGLEMPTKRSLADSRDVSLQRMSYDCSNL